MMKAVVIANGSFPDPALVSTLLAEADVVIAADGGARALIAYDLPLSVVVGDMDSLPPDLLQRWQARGGETHIYPVAKDETDLELAIDAALQRGAQRLVVLGALGGRVDHVLANLLLLASPALARRDAAIYDDGTRVRAITDEAALVGEPGDLLTLLPVTAQVEGIVTEGLHYPLKDEDLTLGIPRGVSNVFTARQATIRVRSGVLLALHTWTGHRPLAW